MGYPLFLTTVIIFTIILIFGFYKIFITKPIINKNPNIPNIQLANLKSPLPSPSQDQPSSPVTPSPKITPKTNSKPGIIGSIRVLQNNISNNNVSSSSSIISGLIDISGTPPSDSSIVITARENNSGNEFTTVVDGIKPQDSERWSWKNAKPGTSYDLIAVLKGRSNNQDIDYAKSQTYKLTAPSTDQIFQVDVGYTISAPTGTITVSCNTHNSNNTWAAVVNYPLISGALMYWLKVGTTSDGNDIAEATVNAQTQNVLFMDNVRYYAQYAVSSVSNPTQYQYSSFSSAQELHCP